MCSQYMVPQGSSCWRWLLYFFLRVPEHLMISMLISSGCGEYNLHTNSASAPKICWQNSMMTFILAVFRVFQHLTFPLPANLPFVSDPVNAWKPGNASAILSSAPAMMQDSSPRAICRHVAKTSRLHLCLVKECVWHELCLMHNIVGWSNSRPADCLSAALR